MSPNPDHALSPLFFAYLTVNFSTPIGKSWIYPCRRYTLERLQCLALYLRYTIYVSYAILRKGRGAGKNNQTISLMYLSALELQLIYMFSDMHLIFFKYIYCINFQLHMLFSTSRWWCGFYGSYLKAMTIIYIMIIFSKPSHTTF